MFILAGNETYDYRHQDLLKPLDRASFLLQDSTKLGGQGDPLEIVLEIQVWTIRTNDH